MKTIRNNVFETNSSSCHSVSISKEPIDKNKLEKFKRFYMRANHYFDNNKVLREPGNKLSYAYTCAIAVFEHSCCRVFSDLDNVYYENTSTDYLNKCQEKFDKVVDSVIKYSEKKGITVVLSAEDRMKVMSVYSMSCSGTAFSMVRSKNVTKPFGMEEYKEKLGEMFLTDPKELFKFCFNNSKVYVRYDG